MQRTLYLAGEYVDIVDRDTGLMTAELVFRPQLRDAIAYKTPEGALNTSGAPGGAEEVIAITIDVED